MKDNDSILALLMAALNAGAVDPGAIETAVDDWLDEHPEATTTVQDGSITEAKLAPAVAENVAAVPELKSAVDYKITIEHTNNGGTRNYALLGIVNGDFVAEAGYDTVWIAVQGYSDPDYSGTRVYDSGKKSSPYSFTISNNTNVYYRVVYGLDNGSFDSTINATLYAYEVKKLNVAVAENVDETKNLKNRFTAVNTELLSIMHGATTSYPQNVIGLYKKAWENNILYWECDVRPCLDGYVLCHDDDIYNHAVTANGETIAQNTVLISNSTVAQLQAYKFGVIVNQQANGVVPGFVSDTIPTLQEFLRFAKVMGAYPVVEIKFAPTQAQMEEICDIIKQYGMLERTCILAYTHTSEVVDYACQNGIKRLSIIIGNGDASTSDVDTAYGYIQSYLSDLDDVFFNPTITNLNNAGPESIVKYAASKNMRMCVWAFSENPSMTTVMNLFNAGVTGFTTNRDNIAEIIQNNYGM